MLIYDSVWASSVWSFDEALNSVTQKCQMDVSIRYWDSTERKVKTCCFDSHFLERPKADNLLGVQQSKVHQLDNKLVEDGFTSVLSMFMELSKLDQVIQGGI